MTETETSNFPSGDHLLPLLAALAICFLIFPLLPEIWGIEYLPFLDHPSHLFRSHVLLNYHVPEFGYHRYFIPNWGLAPNQAADAFMFLTGRVIPLEASVRIFYILFLLFFPFSSLYLIYTLRSENLPYLLFPTALAMNHFMIMGNENFLFSLPVFLVFFTHWYKTRCGERFGAFLLNMFLATLLYYSHMLSFSCALILVFSVSLLERRNRKHLFSCFLIFLPGFLLFTGWTIFKLFLKGPDRFLTGGIHFFPSFGEKMTSLLSGITPGLFQLLPLSLKILYYLLIAVLLFFGLRRLKGRPYYFFSLGLGLLVLFCLLLPKWFIIFEPGQRIAFLILCLLPLILPTDRRIQAGSCLVLLVLCVFLRFTEYQYLGSMSGLITRAVAPFSEVPPEKAGKHPVVLPLILHPYNESPIYHKTYEYYNMRWGGMNPYHLVSPNHTVRYREKPPAPGIYRPFDIKNLLYYYDTVLVIGRDGEKGGDLIRYLESHDFKEEAGNDFTGVFMREKAPRLRNREAP